MVRWIPHQEDQVISNIIAYRADDDLQSPLDRIRQDTSTSTNEVMKFRMPSTEKPVIVILRYKVTPGILKFEKCNIMAFPTAAPPDGFTVMMTKFAIGGLSIQKVNTIDISFTLADVAKTFIDSPVKHPEEFVVNTTMNSNPASGVVSATHTGSLGDLNPGGFLFYFRFGAASGWAVCPVTRKCPSEIGHLSEGEPASRRRRLIIGLAVGGVGVVGVFVAVLVLVCRKRRKKSTEDDSPLSTTNVSLPSSLLHFAYDTGDEKSSQKWEHWAEGGGL